MTTPVRVDDVDDPRLEPFRDLKDKDRRRGGAFVLEGEVVLRMAVKERRYPVLAVLLAENRAHLADLVPSETPVYVVSHAVLEALVGFDLHRGVLALADRGAPGDPSAILQLDGPVTLVGLVGVTNHDNVGGIFRNARALGADGILLDQASCDPLYRKAVRVSVGAALAVPWARVPDAATMLSWLAAHRVTSIALTPDQDAPPLAELPRGARRALLVGTEGPGLPKGVLATADLRARIPIEDGFDSLNVATALGIALYELRRAPA